MDSLSERTFVTPQWLGKVLSPLTLCPCELWGKRGFGVNSLSERTFAMLSPMTVRPRGARECGRMGAQARGRARAWGCKGVGVGEARGRAEPRGTALGISWAV